jgi:uncharacterized protein (UPF0333 family)
MKNKIITGAIVAVAAGLATYFYKRRKNRLSTAASDAYNTMDDAYRTAESKAEDYF